jgi:hypothetical protein
MYKVLIFIFFTSQSFYSFPQTYWKIGNEYGDEILLTIKVNTSENTFVAHTRKDALKDIAGVFTYSVAKAAGKLKYPEIVFIEGKTEQKKDSLLLNGTFTYFDKQYPFTASISGNNFSGKYIDRNKPRLLTGIKLQNDGPIYDYQAIINSAIALTEKNLLNPAWLKSSEWHDFRKKIHELKPKIADDYELAASFVWFGKKLPFTSYEINRNNPRFKSSGKNNSAGIREMKTNTALFDPKTVPSNTKEMDSIAAIIAKKGYTNLILDLRGRNSLNPCNANELLNYLSDKTFTAGVYLTRKWFDTNTSIPKAPDYKKSFQSFSDAGSKSGGLYKEKGRYLNVVPKAKTFKGRVYVLCDSRTSKGSEAIIYELKNEKIVTVAGQKTAGSTILTERLPINNEYELTLPIAEYYNCEGKSLNKSGIEPDITVSGEDVLRYLLKTL